MILYATQITCFLKEGKTIISNLNKRADFGVAFLLWKSAFYLETPENLEKNLINHPINQF